MMIEHREPAYQWGQQVLALVDMLNDGTYPDKPDDAVLVAQGAEGEIVQVGHHEEANQPVYMVEFDGLVVGCLEEEIMLRQELEAMVLQARNETPPTLQSQASPS
jgi:nitrogen fixation protein NifZ